ncbi:hypothetical protein AAJ76_3490001090 [Vairimorpha ceranae]|uniref:Uncharacterized protein n=1 Tax=Vairimorpha ceranae TaxID=40302 RepID=A0A0F9Z6U3_9MICR|nr:hypothetical protein AAJ76_3490001090 [Vairimorpha ceranae]KKO73644.1 hypothetical protein AAJ76_3490001090 [Vairimorpha ceranae]
MYRCDWIAKTIICTRLRSHVNSLEHETYNNLDMGQIIKLK